jgi:predicted PurR-regulated permease PerM
VTPAHCPLLRDILIMLLVSRVLAAALSRPTAALQRRGLPLGVAVGLVQVVGLALVLVLAWFVLPPLVDHAAGFADRVPGHIDRFEGFRRDSAHIRARSPELGPFDQEVAILADRVGSARTGAWSRSSERRTARPRSATSGLLPIQLVRLASPNETSCGRR